MIIPLFWAEAQIQQKWVIAKSRPVDSAGPIAARKMLSGALKNASKKHLRNLLVEKN